MNLEPGRVVFLATRPLFNKFRNVIMRLLLLYGQCSYRIWVRIGRVATGARWIFVFSLIMPPTQKSYKCIVITLKWIFIKW